MAILVKERKTYYYANIGKDGRMRLRSRQEDGSYKEQFVPGVSGLITNIKKTTGEYEGKKVERVEVTITDGEESYILSVSRYSTYGRGLINKLHNVNLNKKVDIEVFVSQYEGRSFAHAIISQNNEPVKAKFDKDTIPKVKKVMAGKKEYDDTSERDEWTDNKLDELINDMKEKPAATAHDEVFEEELADLPF